MRRRHGWGGKNNGCHTGVSRSYDLFAALLSYRARRNLDGCGGWRKECEASGGSFDVVALLNLVIDPRGDPSPRDLVQRSTKESHPASSMSEVTIVSEMRAFREPRPTGPSLHRVRYPRCSLPVCARNRHLHSTV
jgi:hypothetical protein